MWGALARAAVSLGSKFHKLFHPLWVKWGLQGTQSGGASVATATLSGIGLGWLFGEDVEDEGQTTALHALTAFYTLGAVLIALVVWLGVKQLKKMGR